LIALHVHFLQVLVLLFVLLLILLLVVLLSIFDDHFVALNLVSVFLLLDLAEEFLNLGLVETLLTGVLLVLILDEFEQFLFVFVI